MVQFCVLGLNKKRDCQDLKLVVSSISTCRLRWHKIGSSELKISMIQISVGGKCQLRIC